MTYRPNVVPFSNIARASYSRSTEVHRRTTPCSVGKGTGLRSVKNVGHIAAQGTRGVRDFSRTTLRARAVDARLGSGPRGHRARLGSAPSRKPDTSPVTRASIA